MVSTKYFYQEIGFWNFHFSIIILSSFKGLNVNTRIQEITVYREQGMRCLWGGLPFH